MIGLVWAPKVYCWAQRPNSVPKFRNFNFNRGILVKCDIILNFIKIGGYLGDGPRLGQKGLELGLKAQFGAQIQKL